MDDDEYYNKFLKYIHVLELHSEKLAKMLSAGIQNVLNEVRKINFGSEDYIIFRNKIHQFIDAYSS